MLTNLETNAPLAAYSRPGGFNDPDMLEVGNGALTERENRAHFSVWSVMGAPLLAGNDLNKMTSSTSSILTNTEVIALDQDPLGLQGALVRTEGDVEVYAKPLASCGARGVVVFNKGTTASEITLKLTDIWLPPAPPPCAICGHTVHPRVRLRFAEDRGRFRTTQWPSKSWEAKSPGRAETRT